MRVYFDKMTVLELVGQPDGQFVSQSATKTCLAGSWGPMEQDHTIPGDQIRIDIQFGQSHGGSNIAEQRRFDL